MGNKTWGSAGRATGKERLAGREYRRKEREPEREISERDKVRGKLTGNGSESTVKERQKGR